MDTSGLPHDERNPGPQGAEASSEQDAPRADERDDAGREEPTPASAEGMSPQRLNWLMDFLAEDDDEAPPPPAPDPPTAASAEPADDEDNDYLRDPVLQALLDADVIDQAQLMYAVRRHARAPEGPVWRLLLDLPEVDAEDVRAVAANVHDIGSVTLLDADQVTTAGALAQEHLPSDVCDLLRSQRLLPLAYDPTASPGHLMLAAADPLAPDLQHVVQSLDASVTLRYTPPSVIEEHLAAAWSPDAEAPAASPEDPEFTAGDVYEADLDTFDPGHVGMDLDETDLPDEEDASDQDEAVDIAPDDALALEDVSIDDTPEAEPDALDVSDLDFASADLSALVQDVDEEEQEETSIKAQLAALREQVLADKEADEQESFSADAEDTSPDAFGGDAPPVPGDDLDESDAVDDEDDAPLQLSVTPEASNGRYPADPAPPPPEVEADPIGDEPEARDPDEADDAAEIPMDADAVAEASPEQDDAEALTEAEHAPERDDPADAVSQHPLSDADASADDLARALDAEALPDDDVLVDEGQPDPAPGSGDDQGGPDDPSYDGSPTDLHDATPVPDVADWTQRDDADEPPASAEDDADAPAEAQDDGSPEAAEEDPALEVIKQKDRVVAMLLRKDIVPPKAVKMAHRKKDDDNIKDALWRVLARVKGVEREAIFREAARVYAFPEAEIGEGKPDPEFARSVTDTFDEQYRDQMLDLLVAPYEVDLDQQTGAIKVVFITHDPTRPEVHRLLQKLKLERFELRYAPESVVASLIGEAFPRKNEYLERLSDDMAVDLGMSYQAEEGDELV
ncbi:MAG: hypothetical protein GVY18_01580, partial [Bacteroidetes bacterium]|nr:hypothetical protein [Bacteroidota bacterium]